MLQVSAWHVKSVMYMCECVHVEMSFWLRNISAN